MAKIKLASIESFRGKVGNLSFYVSQGEQMARKGDAERSGEFTEEQQKIQQAATVIWTLGSVLQPALKLGFRGNKKKHWSPMNQFANLNKSVVTVTKEETEGEEKWTADVDFTALLCSDGNLKRPKVTVTHDEAGKTLSFTLASSSETFNGSADDEVYALAISVGEVFDATMQRLGTRGEGGTASMDLSDLEEGELHVYVFATTADGKKALRSAYLPLATGSGD